MLRVEKLLPNIAINPQTQLKPGQLKIIEQIRKNGFISDREYKKIVNRAKATRTQDFKKLRNLNLIERKGKGRATYYVLKEK